MPALEDIIHEALELVPGFPEFVYPGDNNASIIAALQAGGHVHFTAGTYSITAIASDTPLTNSLRITGEGRDVVTIRTSADPGGAPGIANDLFQFSGDTFYMSGVKIIGERTAVSLDLLSAQRVERFEIEDCWFENTGAMIKLDNTAAAAGTELGVVRCNRNVCRNVNSGVALRLGDGSASAANDVPIDYFEAVGNDLQTVDKYGIVCNYDDADAAYTYPSATSYAYVAGNRIRDLEGRGASTVTGFGINLSACRQTLCTGNHLENIRKGTRVNIEPIYTKSPRATISNNVIIDCDGDQGCIALKGADSGEQIHCVGNTIHSGTVSFLNGIWIQNNNCFIHGNTIRGAMGNSGIKTQSTLLMTNIHINGNEIYQSSASGSHGIRIDTATITGLEIRNNRITKVAAASGNFRHVLVTLGAGESVTGLVIAGNTFQKEGAGAQNVLAVELSPHATGPITNPHIMQNHFMDANTGISLITAAVTGICRIIGNSEVGVTTDINNAAASTLDNRFNSWS